MIRPLLTLFACICFLFTEAQNEFDRWYFGNLAAVDFTGAPVALTNSAMNMDEGSAAISDAAGNLLFYTNGLSVWNRSHAVMPNGTGLLGHSTSTQSANIVPYPNNTNLYYIFTVDALGSSNTWRYTMVDMSLAGGMGDVVAASKNTLLRTLVSEQNATAMHSNGIDMWVVSHHWQSGVNSNNFYAYLVTCAGVAGSPVISSVGTAFGAGSTLESYGQLKFSRDGTKSGLCIQGQNTAEIYDFDNTTGVFSNPVTLSTTIGQAYGIDFSPNSRVVYVQGRNIDGCYQYDMGAVNIPGSEYLAGNEGAMGGMQLAADNKIYIVKSGNAFLTTVDNPNVLGVGCGYNSLSFSLSGRTGRTTLPNLIQGFSKIMSCLPLAIEQPVLSGTANPDYHLLEWKGTLADQLYTLEYSGYDESFQELTITKANSYVHRTPERGVITYRLRSRAEEGRDVYSNTVQLRSLKAGELNYILSGRQLELLTDPEAGEYSFQLVATSGAEVMQGKGGLATRKQWDLNTLDSGVYLLRIQQGTHSRTYKIVL